MIETLSPPPPEVVATPPKGHRRPVRSIGELPPYLAAAGLTCLIVAMVLTLWDASRAIPFYYDGDALATGAHFKSILETGWYENQPALGAPFGQTYHDFPQADNLHMAVVAVMGLVVGNWAVAFNAYYLLGFPLAALTAVWFFRLAGVSPVVSVALAVLFALAPYHFERNQGHLFLSSYYTVPLAAGIVLMALRGSALWGKRVGARWPAIAWLTGPGAFTVLAMVLVAAGSSYYGVFTAMLLGIAATVAGCRDRAWRRFAGAGAAGVVLVATMFVNMAPDLLYALGRDANPAALTRNPGEAEVYGLKPIQLLLPSELHRWEPLADLREYYNERFPLPGESPSLGVIAGVGLLALLVVTVVAMAAPTRGNGRTATTLRHLALLSFLALAMGSIGGLSSLIALLFTDKLRGWNRLSIFIAAFCLGAVGLGADGLARWARRNRPDSRVAPALPVMLAAGVLALGVADQTSDRYRPRYADVRESYTSDAAYVWAIEDQLPAGAAVYQMPHQEFPETPPVNGVYPPEQLQLYLSSTDTRWSGGGLRGRPQADWPSALADEPISRVVPLLALAGFSGISLDRKLLGDDAPKVEAALEMELGAGPGITSRDGRFAFWSLAGVGEQAAGRHDEAEIEVLLEGTLLPPMSYLPEFEGPGIRDGSTVWHSRIPKQDLLLQNARKRPIAARLSFAVTSSTGATAAQVRLPGRNPISLDVTRGPAWVDADIVLPPGRSVVQLRFSSTGPEAVDPDDLTFEILDIELTEPAFERIRP